MSCHMTARGIFLIRHVVRGLATIERLGIAHIHHVIVETGEACQYRINYHAIGVVTWIFSFFCVTSRKTIVQIVVQIKQFRLCTLRQGWSVAVTVCLIIVLRSRDSQLTIVGDDIICEVVRHIIVQDKSCAAGDSARLVCEVGFYCLCGSRR